MTCKNCDECTAWNPFPWDERYKMCEWVPGGAVVLDESSDSFDIEEFSRIRAKMPPQPFFIGAKHDKAQEDGPSRRIPAEDIRREKCTPLKT